MDSGLSVSGALSMFALGVRLIQAGLIVATAVAGVYIILEIFTRGGGDK